MYRLHTYVFVLLAASLVAGAGGAAGKRPQVKSAVSVEKPTIEGDGPFSVTFAGTATVDAKAKAFNGVRMSIRTANQKEINALVSLPEASPQPGQTRPIQFTTDLPRGSYTGVVEMAYTDADGKLQTMKFDVPKFDVPIK